MGKAREVTSSIRPGEWTSWQPVSGLSPMAPAVVAELLDGGQAFRWYSLAPSQWIGAWSDCLVQLRHTGAGTLEWSAPPELAARVRTALPHYLGLDALFSEFTDALPWRSDPHIAECIRAFPGLRILRQPFGETLLCFLCSATKQIVQIKQMVALLAVRHGRPICPVGVLPQDVAGIPPAALAGAKSVHALPTWDELAATSEAELRGCLLGFRAKYIAETARFLAGHPRWLEETESLPYPEAKARLCSLPGVGEKVADCVLLFGAGKLEAFPVDVWILKTMAKRYDLDGWKPAQLAQFGRAHFGRFAGLAQQFLFAWERRVGRYESAGAPRIGP